MYVEVEVKGSKGKKEVTLLMGLTVGNSIRDHVYFKINYGHKILFYILFKIVYPHFSGVSKSKIQFPFVGHLLPLLKEHDQSQDLLSITGGGSPVHTHLPAILKFAGPGHH
jgi:hypothetical protein